MKSRADGLPSIRAGVSANVVAIMLRGIRMSRSSSEPGCCIMEKGPKTQWEPQLSLQNQAPGSLGAIIPMGRWELYWRSGARNPTPGKSRQWCFFAGKMGKIKISVILGGYGCRRIMQDIQYSHNFAYMMKGLVCRPAHCIVVSHWCIHV